MDGPEGVIAIVPVAVVRFLGFLIVCTVCIISIVMVLVVIVFLIRRLALIFLVRVVLLIGLIVAAAGPPAKQRLHCGHRSAAVHQRIYEVLCRSLKGLAELQWRGQHSRHGLRLLAVVHEHEIASQEWRQQAVSRWQR